ncbi:MAG: hypothetical protein LBL33_08265 [Tannerella sp.]|nr:hypothetical protein [Tannerella sp.]
MEADKKNKRRNPGRKSKANRAVHRCGIKLNDDENAKFKIQLPFPSIGNE